MSEVMSSQNCTKQNAIRVTWQYIGEELALFWTNPWSGTEEKIATFWWPAHPIEETNYVQLVFEAIAERAAGERIREPQPQPECGAV